jgi:hypothetical protein
LPLEIHRKIFRVCDTPTLFHLIHTSSYTRQECLQLFWKFRDDNTWYRPENSTKIFFKQHPIVYDCPEFASHITQVEITLSFVSFDRKQKFWRKFQNIFPSAPRVVLYDPSLEQASSFPIINEEYKGVRIMKYQSLCGWLRRLSPL